jgi:hypothetical protein
LSSVTTVFAYFVGRSVVSAMTHTPASGPFELVTTPPISDGPIFCAYAHTLTKAANNSEASLMTSSRK